MKGGQRTKPPTEHKLLSHHLLESRLEYRHKIKNRSLPQNVQFHIETSATKEGGSLLRTQEVRTNQPVWTSEDSLIYFKPEVEGEDDNEPAEFAESWEQERKPVPRHFSVTHLLCRNRRGAHKADQTWPMLPSGVSLSSTSQSSCIKSLLKPLELN